jgi:adenosine deaminase
MHPKIELHLHLDGSLNVNTLFEFAIEDNIINKKETINEFKRKIEINNNDKTLIDYLSKFKIPVNTLQNKERLYRVGKEIIENLSQQGYLYAEIRFAPEIHTAKGLKIDEVVNAVQKGLDYASKELNFNYGLILCCMRHASIDKAHNIINLGNYYKEQNNTKIVGVDLAGDEFNYPPELFKKCFLSSKLPITIHAGEARGFDSVLNAVEMNATRIGHGVRAIESEKTIDIVLEKEIVFELCPISNHQTNVFENVNQYPIRELLDKGVLLTLNTDNQTVSNTNLDNEVKFIKTNFNVTDEEIFKMIKTSAKYSFANDNIKSDLISQIETIQIEKKLSDKIAYKKRNNTVKKITK